MSAKNLIVIEDDIALCAQFKAMLEMEKFNVRFYHSAEDYLLSSSVSSNEPHIYLIDLNLPGLAGSELVKVIRYKDKLSPIFIISGQSPDSALHKCLAAGADDYLCKPYNPDHLLLKVRNAQSKLRFMIGSMMEFGVKLVPEAKLISRDGIKVKLTNREYSILETLLSLPEEIFTREKLMKQMADDEITARTIDVHVSSLRRKIVKLDLEIETCRGKGYRVKGLALNAMAI